jgi:extracellular factor (EF) 3-hydroxypalmitic acid methyl ester biosynthesis protein
MLKPASYSYEEVFSALLDSVNAALKCGAIQESLEALYAGLRGVRELSSDEEWHAFVQSVCLTHPVRVAAHDDPLTWRAFHKPRGYAGDAIALDMIYYPDRVDLSNVSVLGHHVFKFTVERPTAKAVRNRRKILAKLVDDVAANVDQPKVLSVACGHLREVELSEAVTDGLLREYVGLDQDLESLDVVKDDYEYLDVDTCHASVKDLIIGKVRFEDFDLIYAAGLLDYLNQKAAQKLTTRLFGMLRSGGTLLTANVLPGSPDTGYMESYGGWKLISRDESAMLNLLAEISTRHIDTTQLFTEEEGIILFSQIVKQ